MQRRYQKATVTGLGTESSCLKTKAAERRVYSLFPEGMGEESVC